MKDRIKMLRKSTQKNQTDFGAMMGVSMSAVQKWEMGLSVPSNSVIELIAQKTGVNEQWLRTGEGEMFSPQTRNEELAVFFGTILKDTDESYKKRLLYALSKLDESQWQVLIDLEKLMAGEE